MDATQKLIRKLSRKDRMFLDEFVDQVKDPGAHAHLNITKLSGNKQLYRARKRQFRILFHFEPNGTVTVDAIKLRNEKTYRDV